MVAVSDVELDAKSTQCVKENQNNRDIILKKIISQESSQCNPSKSPSKIMSKLRIIKNLVVVCCGFLLLFTAFQSLANLQSTINSAEGLGVTSQSIIYGALITSSLFLPKIIIKKLGCKWTLVLSILTYCPYVAANFYPHLGTFVPTAILLGLGAAPLWSAKCTYLNKIGFLYATYVQDSSDVVISKFFGVFFMFFQNTQIWGNLVSYYVLKPANESAVNVSIEQCGITFCKDSNESNPNLQVPSEEKRYMLIGIYLICAILAAVIVALFLDPLKDDKDKQNVEDLNESVFSKIMATLKHMKKTNQLLLVPLTVFSGIEQAFFLGDFSRAYVACAWGVHHVGFVFICYGVVNTVMSLISGRLLKYFKRFIIITMGAIGNIAVCIGLFVWKPSPEQPEVFFVLAGIWGFSDAIWQTQVNAFYGVLFKGEEEAAFSNYRLWESAGFAIAFAYSALLCINIKIFILLSFLGVGVTGYYLVEIRTNMNNKKYNLDSEK